MNAPAISRTPAWMDEQLRQHAPAAPQPCDPRALVLWCRGLAEAARNNAPGSWIEERMPFSWSTRRAA